MNGVGDYKRMLKYYYNICKIMVYCYNVTLRI